MDGYIDVPSLDGYAHCQLQCSSRRNGVELDVPMIPYHRKE